MKGNMVINSSPRGSKTVKLRENTRMQFMHALINGGWRGNIIKEIDFILYMSIRVLVLTFIVIKACL